MTTKLLFQSQWGKGYGPHLSVLGFTVWWFGFQILILNFRIYFSIRSGDDEY
jgi:hypothetical protein